MGGRGCRHWQNVGLSVGNTWDMSLAQESRHQKVPSGAALSGGGDGHWTTLSAVDSQCIFFRV